MSRTRPQRRHWSERLSDRLAVEIEPGRRALRLTCGGVPFLRVDEALETEIIGPPPWRDRAEEEEIRCGPGLVIALALRGRFSLHGSAVARGGAATLFLGESGAGKSTLAREVARAGRGWRRLTDDISPIEAWGPGLFLFPGFPQLKLASAERWSGPPDAAVPIRTLCLLRPVGARAPVRCERLSTSDAALALLAHTVASRLFDEELLARHLELAARAVRFAPVLRLDYPHRPASPVEIAALLES